MSPQAQKVEYSPKPLQFDNFGRYSYDGQHNIKASDEESANIRTRQQIIASLLPELGTTGDMRSGQIKNFGDIFTQRLLEHALPRFRGDFYGRGLEGSTSYARGFADLLSDAAQRGIFAGEDLLARDEQSKINRLGSAESGLQNAFARLLSIGNMGQSFNNQMFNIDNQNANRQTQVDQINATYDFTNNQGGLNDIANLASLGGMLAFGGGGGSSSGGVTDLGRSAASSALSKTGSTGAPKSKSSFGDYAKDPDTWIKLAHLAAMASAACHVASEIFGGMYKMKTIYARAYVKKVAPAWFSKFYIKKGMAIARNVRRNPALRRKLRPIFEAFAEKGKQYLESQYAAG